MEKFPNVGDGLDQETDRLRRPDMCGLIGVKKIVQARHHRKR